MIKKKKRALNAVSVPVEALFHIIMILVCAGCIIPFIFVVIIVSVKLRAYRILYLKLI